MSEKLLKLIALFGALWYGLGLIRFLARFSLDGDGVVTEVPILILFVFALSAITGLIGILLLLDEPKDAFWAFALSLACSVFAFGWVLVTIGIDPAYPFSTIIMPILILAISLSYVLLSRQLHQRKVRVLDQSN